MIRRRLLIVFLPALLVLALAGAFAWLLHTESGARWVWARVAAAVPQLSAGSLEGDLRSGLTLCNVHYAGGGTDLRLDRVDLRVALDLLPPAVSVEALEGGRLEIATAAGGNDRASTGTTAETLQRLALPIPVRFESVGLETLAWQRPGDDAPLEIHRLSLAGRWADGWEIDRIRLNFGQRLSVDGSATLGLQPPFPLEARLNAQRMGQPPGQAGLPEALSARADGSLQDGLKVQAESEKGGIHLSGRLAELLTRPNWDLALQAERLALGTADTPVEVRQAAATSRGDPDDYTVAVTGELVVDHTDPLSVALSGTGDRNGITVGEARAQHPAGSLNAQGTVTWQHGFAVTAEASLERLQPQPWVATWPDGHPLSGSLSLAWQGERVDVTDVALAAADTDLRMSGALSVDPQAGRIEGRLAWQGFRWPLAAAEPAIASDSGQLDLQGRPSDWRASGRIRLAAADVPEGELRLSARGDRDGLHADIERGDVLGGSFEGAVDYRWANAPQWSAEVTAQSLRTAPLWPEYAGVVSGHATASGRPADRRIEIDIASLDGTLRGRSVHAEGRLVVADGVPRAESLQLRAGQSGIRLDGNPRQDDGLRFTADIVTLADFIDGATGALQADGRLQLGGDRPQLDLTLDGRQLGWRDWHAGMLDVRGDGGYQVRLEDAELGGYAVDGLQLDTTGDTPLQRIQAEARLNGTRLTARLDGGVVDWQQPLESGWTGQIAELQARNETLGFLELRQPTALQAAADSVDLDNACLRGPSDGKACIATHWQAHGDLIVDASFDAISLDVLRLLRLTRAAFTQRLTGDVAWRKPPTGEPTADVQMQISAGDVTFPNEEASVLSTGAGRLVFRVRDGELQDGHFELPVAQAGTVDADFSVAELARGADAPVDARVRIELDDIAPLAQLVPALDVVAGRVSADLRIAGTVSDPALTGHAAWVHGRIEHFASGLVLSDIQLAGAVYQYDYTELNGTFRAGAGQGRIKAGVDFGDLMNPEITLSVSGKDLVLVDVPDLGLTADPDLNFRWAGDVLTIDGRVLVSQARLSPRYLPTSTVNESPDVVVVAGTPPEQDNGTTEESDFKLDGSVEVIFGEDVSVELERATADIGGQVTFLWDHQLVPIGDGTLTVSGEVKAYGQLLQITEGRIRFPRKPANNPRLDIRAEREIYGNPQIKAAGVHITGTAKRPNLEVYSDPMTTQERALTLLITGRDFNYDQGTGGIAVGMYVAPRLYVSYGIGLFDDENVITARYDLKGGLGVKATSGQRETGMDISYTFED